MAWCHGLEGSKLDPIGGITRHLPKFAFLWYGGLFEGTVTATAVRVGKSALVGHPSFIWGGSCRTVGGGRLVSAGSPWLVELYIGESLKPAKGPKTRTLKLFFVRCGTISPCTYCSLFVIDFKGCWAPSGDRAARAVTGNLVRRVRASQGL